MVRHSYERQFNFKTQMKSWHQCISSQILNFHILFSNNFLPLVIPNRHARSILYKILWDNEILGYYQILVSSHYERLWETDLKTIIFAFITILDNSKHFLKISIFVPKKVHIMVILGWNFPFWSSTFGLDFDFYSSFLHQYLAKFKELIILYTWNAFLRHC